jgi:adenosylmethionine-8-amino-7-oxononanoate aminotransferase
MTLSERDRAVLWHPFSRLGSDPAPIGISRARGATLYTEDGREILDGVSSWWVNAHGHSHPHIAKRISAQAENLEHVIFAGFTHEPAVSLAERLLKVLPRNQSKIFFSDNGSTAVETAMKMVLQYQYYRSPQRRKIISLEGCYHGDTFGAMSANERVRFYAPFDDYLFDVDRIKPPQAADDPSIDRFKEIVSKGETALFLFEPLLQGVAGMNMYSAAGLDRMLQICRSHGVITIADEVMTGFGRTGRLFASEYLTELPDVMCLSKALTGGFLPLGVTSACEEIFKSFVSQDPARMFFHGHSYTANPLACAAAGASLDLFEEASTWENIRLIESAHKEYARTLRGRLDVEEISTLGTVLRFVVKTQSETGYLNEVRDYLYQGFLSRGVLLRPLGNIVYVMPPYCITQEELSKIYRAITEVLTELGARAI